MKVFFLCFRITDYSSSYKLSWLKTLGLQVLAILASYAALINNYQPTLIKNPEERRPKPHRGESLKSCVVGLVRDGAATMIGQSNGVAVGLKRKRRRRKKSREWLLKSQRYSSSKQFRDDSCIARRC
jgi:hypothetical protein